MQFSNHENLLHDAGNAGYAGDAVWCFLGTCAGW